MIGLVFNGGDHSPWGYSSGGHYADYAYTPGAAANGNGAGSWQRAIKNVKKMGATLRSGRRRR
jgi:hypothetical protein